MPEPRIAILDYGSGNIESAKKAIEKAGAIVEVTKETKVIDKADAVVVPGVGAYSWCMQGLDQVGGSVLINNAISNNKPILGICVGMQIFFESGEEHGVNTKGLGLLPGKVTKIKSKILPHMGWNTLSIPKNSILFKNISEEERVYFVHSFGVRNENYKIPEEFVATWATYGDDKFLAACEWKNIYATQFHPEKSSDVGQKILKNWLSVI